MCPLSKEWQRAESRPRTLGECILLFIGVYISRGGLRPHNRHASLSASFGRHRELLIHARALQLSRRTARASPYYRVYLSITEFRGRLESFSIQTYTIPFLPRNYASLSRIEDRPDESLNENGNGKTFAADKILLNTVHVRAIMYNLIRKILTIGTNLFNTHTYAVCEMIDVYFFRFPLRLAIRISAVYLR